MESRGISKGGGQWRLGIGRGLGAGGGGHHVAQSQWFCFPPFCRGHSFSAFCFLLTDSLFFPLVIDYLGIGFVLFAETIDPDVLV